MRVDSFSVWTGDASLINATLFEYCIMQWSMFDVIISNRIIEVSPFKANYFEIMQMVLKIAKELKDHNTKRVPKQYAHHSLSGNT